MKKTASIVEPDVLELNVSDPGSIAAKYLYTCYKGPNDVSRLVRFNQAWLVWNDGCYKPFTDEYFRAETRNWLEQQTLVRYDKNGDLVPAVCTVRHVTEVLDGLLSRTAFQADETGFFWIRPENSFTDAASIVTFRNGLLDTNKMKLHKHTPDWFATATLPYDYARTAKCPNWLNWLAQTSEEDEDWIECLQLWFGYNLIPDTSRQKFAHFYGLPRSGKGTAMRILIALLGAWNCASPTLSQLGSNKYVLSTMVGKLAVMVSDAVISRNVDSKVVMEILSAIIGEDCVAIDEKYKAIASSVKLAVRFTITSNEPLKWPDPTNKLAARCLVFPFARSYAGKEDPKVEAALMSELPGIANWALEGLRKLKAGAQLRGPKKGLEKHQLFRDLDSPLNVFCRTMLKETALKNPHSGQVLGVPVDAVHELWFAWSKDEGRMTKGQTKTHVKSLILNAFPHVEIKNRGPRGAQKQTYVGLLLTTEGTRKLRQALKRKGNIQDFKASLGI